MRNQTRPVTMLCIAALLSMAWTSPSGTVSTTPWIPTIQRTTLENGLTIFTSHVTNNGMATVGVLIGAGSACDPMGKAGLAHLVASSIMRGPTSGKPEDFASRLNLICSQLEIEVSRDASLFLFELPSSNIPELMGLVSQAITAPSLTQATLEAVRDQALVTLESKGNEIGYVLDRNLHDFLFVGHPYGTGTWGTEASLKNIAPEDLATFHRDYYGANNAAIAVVGDVQGIDVPAIVKNDLGGWRKANKTAPTIATPAMPEEMRIRLVNRAGSNLTHVCLARATGGMRSAEYATTLVLANILAGGPEARLCRELATNLRGCYNVRATVEPGAVNTLRIEATCRDKDTPAFVTQVNRVLNRVAEDGVTAEELNLAQKRIRLNTLAKMVTPNELTRTILTWHAHQMDPTQPQGFLEDIDRLTTAAVSATAKGLLRPDRFALVVIGDRAAIAEDLRRFADVEVVEFAGEIPVPAMRTVLKKLTK